MAKRKINKSQKIRDTLAELGASAPTDEVIAALAAQRITVSRQQVFAVRPKKANGYEPLILAKRLADKMGGVDRARAALDVLAKLL